MTPSTWDSAPLSSFGQVPATGDTLRLLAEAGVVSPPDLTEAGAQSLLVLCQYEDNRATLRSARDAAKAAGMPGGFGPADPDAPASLRHCQSLKVHLGTADVVAKIRLLDRDEILDWIGLGRIDSKKVDTGTVLKRIHRRLVQVEKARSPMLGSTALAKNVAWLGESLQLSEPERRILEFMTLIVVLMPRFWRH